ncbi:MAG: hypothetical protein AAF441_09025 [Pseudomonadota bacterium]
MLGPLNKITRCKHTLLLIHGCLAVFLALLANGAPATAQSGTPAACTASPAEVARWAGADGLPVEVRKADSCGYNRFAWQEFLALTNRASGAFAFTAMGSSTALFPAGSGVPPSYPGGDGGRMKAGPMGKTPQILPAPEIAQAASLVPLIDKHRRWVHYSVLTNKTQWTAIAGRYPGGNSKPLYVNGCYNDWGGSNFSSVGSKFDNPKDALKLPSLPPGSVELKLAWRVLETCDLPDSPKADCEVDDASRFITVRGDVNPYGPGVLAHERKDVLLGLIGMHIVHKTFDNPEWVWATFEHRDNAPDCPANDAAQTDVSRNNMFCTSCPVKVAKWRDQLTDPNAPTRTDACGTTNPTLPQTVACQVLKGKAVVREEGEDAELVCSANPSAFKFARPALYDARVCDVPPEATKVCRLPPGPADQLKLVLGLNRSVEAGIADLGASAAVLANYRLIGTMWFEGSCRSDPNAKCPRHGMTQLSNTTMETFVQGIPCTVCHGKNQFNPVPFPDKPYARGLADRSFIFQRIKQFADCRAG